MTNSLRVAGNDPVRASATALITGLTPGPHTFTAVYRSVGSGTVDVLGEKHHRDPGLAVTTREGRFLLTRERYVARVECGVAAWSARA